MPPVYDLARHLLDCACRWLEETCPVRQCVIPGVEVAWDDCCDDGMLAINVVNQYPSRTFPTIDPGAPASCDIPYLAVVYRVTVLRCVPAGTAQAGPTCEELDRAAQLQLADMSRVWEGVTCCLNDRDCLGALVGSAYRWVLGNHVTVGPEGGCAGSVLDLTVGLPLCLPCCEGCSG